jgi:hypothetical protein
MNPFLRGLYILNIRGLSIEETSVTMDNSFLSEIMEWNEKVEEADSKESLENIKKDVDVVLLNLYKLVDNLSYQDKNITSLIITINVC